MITFKEFLLEGGKATVTLGTVRATQMDVQQALKFVAKTLKIDVTELEQNLLGSGRVTLKKKDETSGDVDIAINEKNIDRKQALAAMLIATGMAPRVTGGSTYSFAVPTAKARKVQVDLMFVPDVEWAKFSHHASENSEHKSGVRNELIHSALKFSHVHGEDVRHKDDDGNDIARASRAYKLDKGAERIFKIAPLRKDGKGRVKSMVKAEPDEVRQTLDDEGMGNLRFNPKADTITDPEKFAQLLFGPKGKAKDMMSTEQMIKMIRRYKPDEADKIFTDAVRGMKRLKFAVPQELKQYEV